MAVEKLSQITPSPNNPTNIDQFVGVRGGNLDLLFSELQMQSAFGGGGVGGPSVAVGVTPPVTSGSPYATDTVIGGVMAFPGVFGNTGSGEVRLARVTCAQPQNVSWTLYLFNANPVASSLVDAQVPAMAAADAPKLLMALELSPFAQLGATIFAATVDAQVALGAGQTTLWGVLVTNDVLTTPFATTGDVMVELTVTQD